MSHNCTIALLLALLATYTTAVDVPAFTSFQQGGSLDGKLVRIRPTTGTPSVEGATPVVTDDVLSILPPFADIIDIYAPKSTFAQVSLSGMVMMIVTSIWFIQAPTTNTPTTKEMVVL